MATNEERLRVAAELRECASWGDEDDDCLVDIQEWGEVVLNLLDCGDTEGECYRALADLIDPDGGYDAGAGKSSDPTERGIESIKEWCLGAMEGADGALDSMLCEIVGAIEDYQHPERIEYISFKDIGCADCDSLLKLANEMADDADSFSRSARLAADEGDHKMAVLFASIADDYIERANRIRSALGVSRGDQQKA